MEYGSEGMAQPVLGYTVAYLLTRKYASALD